MMRETSIVLTLLLVPLAAAQTTDPTVNESDYNTTAPSGDDQYLNDTATQYGVNESTSDNSTTTTGDPAVAESDFDTSVPTNDQAYLDDAEKEIGTSSSSAATGSGKATPGFELVGLAVALALAVALVRRR